MTDALFRQKGCVAFLLQLIILSLSQGGDDAVDLVIFIRGLLCRAGDDQGVLASSIRMLSTSSTIA